MDIASLETLGYIALGGVAVAYIAGMPICQAYSNLRSRKISSQDELSNLRNKECKRLDLNPNDCICILEKEDQDVCRTEDGRKVIRLGGSFANEGSLKHELYHIKTGRSKNWLHYYLIQEPRATLYETFGIKL